MNQRGVRNAVQATAALKSGRITEVPERNAASGRLLCPKARMRRDGNKSWQMWPKPVITEAAKVVCGVAANATQKKVLCPGLTLELSRAAKRRRLGRIVRRHRGAVGPPQRPAYQRNPQEEAQEGDALTDAGHASEAQKPSSD